MAPDPTPTSYIPKDAPTTSPESIAAGKPIAHEAVEAAKKTFGSLSSLYDDPEELYKGTSPPPFGRAMLKYFNLSPEYINLNHGSYGTPPLPVHQAYNRLTLEVEQNPDRFHRFTYLPLLTQSRELVAKLIGAKSVDECVFVQNASMGLNTVLRNIEWEEGDVIFDCNTTYHSISRTVQVLADTSPHPTISHFPLLFPTTHSHILASFRAHLRSAQAQAKPGKRRVAVIDSIVSNPGVLLPWKEMVKICKEEGVLSVVDAAHSIGQEVGLNLEEAKPDFWVSNLHKWLYTKRGCAVLYIPERWVLANSFFVSTGFVECACLGISTLSSLLYQPHLRISPLQIVLKTTSLVNTSVRGSISVSCCLMLS
ncbi:hypothetical protein AX16_004723 [Volvariella volvacea WC 439]|nr:hypothetical protein AX16_004723 [Volvariella volvacea WC 439]